MCKFMQVCVCGEGGEGGVQNSQLYDIGVFTFGHSLSVSSVSVGIYCCLELDEYGKFERKARTLPVTLDNATLNTTWDQVM